MGWKKHQYSEHGKLSNECTECGKEFNVGDVVWSHTRLGITKEKRHICQSCYDSLFVKIED